MPETKTEASRTSDEARITAGASFLLLLSGTKKNFGRFEAKWLELEPPHEFKGFRCAFISQTPVDTGLGFASGRKTRAQRRPKNWGALRAAAV